MPKACALALLLPLAIAAAGWTKPAPAPAPEPSPTVASIATGYAKYRLITPNPVFVDPQLAMLCAPASQAVVDSTRTEHGPHANAAISVYMNELAAEAFAAKVAPYPVGAVIVKEKHFLSYRGADGKTVNQPVSGVGGMVKRASGYDAQDGDWEYFYFEDAAKIEHGPIESCANCHASTKTVDHVFGSWQLSKQ